MPRWARGRHRVQRRGPARSLLARFRCRTRESARRNCRRPTVRRVRGLRQVAVPDRRRVPRPPALRPADPVPGTVPRIAPRCGLVVRTAPSGKTKCTSRGAAATTALSTKLLFGGRKLSPRLWQVWMVCGQYGAQGAGAERRVRTLTPRAARPGTPRAPALWPRRDRRPGPGTRSRA